MKYCEKKSFILCVRGVLQRNSAMIFTSAEAEISDVQKSYFSISRSRTPPNRKDTAIYNNSLQLKAVY